MLKVTGDTIFENNESYNHIDKENRELYDRLVLAMQLMDTDEFEIIRDHVEENGIYFEITTEYPNQLPENLAIMFFNINHNFNVRINESYNVIDINKRHFFVELIKA